MWGYIILIANLLALAIDDKMPFIISLIGAVLSFAVMGIVTNTISSAKKLFEMNVFLSISFQHSSGI